MRALVIDDAAKADVNSLRQWAEAPDHAYRPGITSAVPGDDPRFCMYFERGFRCVYTITEMQGEKYRHLSISVTGEKYPNPIAAWMIADLFGFAGWDGRSEKPPENWQFAVNEKEHCVVVAQKLGVEALA